MAASTGGFSGSTLGALAAQAVAQTAIASLNAYQKHVSPRKGFACPHRLLYGTDSCSEYMKQRLLQQDLLTAIRLAPPRFQACKAAALSLSQAKTQTQTSGGCIVIPCCIPI